MRKARYKNLSSEDAEIRSRIDRACREVEAAMRIARQVRGGSSSRTLRELGSLYKGLQDVGAANPIRSEDPDLIPESERNKRYRDKLREERTRLRAEKRARKSGVTHG